jgi:hypothetical protein
LASQNKIKKIIKEKKNKFNQLKNKNDFSDEEKKKIKENIEYLTVE